VSSPNYLFNYDARGMRESFNDFGTIQSYLYDTPMAVQETSSNTQSVPTHNYLTMPGGEVLVDYATVGNTTTPYMPLHDVIGSTVGLLSTAGFTTYAYEPFGKPTATGPASSFPYLFAGMEYDFATGLYHTPARYYSPTLQRFLSEDPIQFDGGQVNLFGYVGDDPANLSDPSGNCPVCLPLVAGGLGGIYGYLGVVATNPYATRGQIIRGIAVGAAAGVVSSLLPGSGLLGPTLTPLLRTAIGKLAFAGFTAASAYDLGAVATGGRPTVAQTAMAAGFGMLGEGIGQGAYAFAVGAGDAGIEAELVSQTYGATLSGNLALGFDELYTLNKPPAGGLAGQPAFGGQQEDGHYHGKWQIYFLNKLLGGAGDSAPGSAGPPGGWRWPRSTWEHAIRWRRW
jgi:RHS repeat-associated protein